MKELLYIIFIASYFILHTSAFPCRAAEFRSPKLEEASRELETEDLPAEISADKLLYDNKTKIYTAESTSDRCVTTDPTPDGCVEIKYGKFHLYAIRAIYNSETGDVFAEGDAEREVVIKEEESRLTGKRVRINIKSKLGEIEEGTGFIEPCYYFTGKKIILEAEDVFVFHEGSYTACNQDPPDWKLWAKKGRIHLENYASLTHLVVYANRVPIMYVPYGVFPVKTKRATGLLLPNMGTSDRGGVFVRNAFYWAARDWLDFTFNGDYYTRLGFGGGGQFRAALSKEDSLQVSNFYIHENDTGKDRWEVDGNMNNTLPLGFKGLGQMNLTGDKNYYRDYSHRNSKGMGWKKVDIQQKWYNEQRSLYSLTRNWERLSFNNTIEYSRDISGRFKKEDQRLLDFESTIWKHPELLLTAPPQPVPYTPLFFQMESSYLSYEKRDMFDFPERMDEEILRNDRFDFHPEITLPWSPAPYITLTPRAGIRETWWKKDKEKTNRNRVLLNLGFLVEGPEISRIFQRGEGGILAKYKHLIRPAVEYRLTPDHDRSDIIEFDEIDVIPPVERVDFSLTQQLLQKTESKGLSGDVMDLVNLKISESFDIREAKRRHRLIEDKKQPWSPVTGDLEVRLGDYLFLNADIQYNLYHHQIDSRNYSFNFAYPKWCNFSVGQRWQRNRTYSRDQGRSTSTFSDTFRGDTGINLWNKLALNVSWVYNLQDELWIEQEYALEWRSQCWSFRVNFLRNYTAESDPGIEDNFTIEREDVFYFTLNLYSLDAIQF